MDQQSQEVLNAILAKEPHELTPQDIAILRARLSYVGKNSREKFADVLKEQTPEQGEKKADTNESAETPGSTNENGSQPSAGQSNPSSQQDEDGDEE